MLGFRKSWVSEPDGPARAGVELLTGSCLLRPLPFFEVTPRAACERWESVLPLSMRGQNGQHFPRGPLGVWMEQFFIACSPGHRASQASAF